MTGTTLEIGFTPDHVAKGFRPGDLYWTAATMPPTALHSGAAVQFLPNPRIVREPEQRASVIVTVDAVGVLMHNPDGTLGEVHWLSPGEDLGLPEALRFTGSITSMAPGIVARPALLTQPVRIVGFTWVDGPHGEFAGNTTHMWLQLADAPRAPKGTVTRHDLPDLLDSLPLLL